jgi:hypothetical protein
LRGGSWNNNQRNARCAIRNRNIPDNFNDNIGFRVVVSIVFAVWPADPDVYAIDTFKDTGRGQRVGLWPTDDENQRDPPPVASAVKGERRPAK